MNERVSEESLELRKREFDEFEGFKTLESFISAEQHLHPRSRGFFADILRRIGVASKIIGSRVQRAGLTNVLGKAGRVNIQGEQQMKLDVMSNELLMNTLQWLPAVAGMASEEEEGVMRLPPHPDEHDTYVIMFDPLDGSSNIDANVSIGTIFSIHRRVTKWGACEEVDFLQPGRRLLAAGYVIYGSSTMFVYSTGNGVHGFTLDPEVGEYVLSHPDMRIPDQCRCFSANETNYKHWDEPTKRFADHIRFGSDPHYEKTSSRYIGSMVADFHRNLLYGGVFLYPADKKHPTGKLRLLFECAPLAWLAEQAGGAATTGRQDILDIQPEKLHQRCPIVIGNSREVDLYRQMVADHDQGN
ncbi:MAG: class 1 fructose-bisphosphatase [Deltaproteobacteria bacterium]|nr:MAG: class 1 fructose-bisphosphatase [Deltaproteobacteria bacterium]